MFFTLFPPRNISARPRHCASSRRTGAHDSTPGFALPRTDSPGTRSDLGFVWRVNSATNRLDGWWADDQGEPVTDEPLPPGRGALIQAALARSARRAVVVIT